ncbi:MAG: hypothetical protein EB114_10825 [Betaproteobacteria bacterium]|nr:hypothetical protein [Betaproteobacteria bacterium]
MTQRWERAKALLGDEFLQEVFAELEKDNIERIINSNPDEIDKREEAYGSIRAINQVKARIEAIAAEGEMVKKRFRIF